MTTDIEFIALVKYLMSHDGINMRRMTRAWNNCSSQNRGGINSCVLPLRWLSDTGFNRRLWLPSMYKHLIFFATAHLNDFYKRILQKYTVYYCTYCTSLEFFTNFRLFYCITCRFYFRENRNSRKQNVPNRISLNAIIIIDTQW